MNEIPDERLALDQIPQPIAGWHEIGGFSLTFNEYEFYGGVDPCVEIANHGLKTFETSGTLPETLIDLRTCLFFQQRRWWQYGYDPDEETMEYPRAGVVAIRGKVKNQEEESSY